MFGFVGCIKLHVQAPTAVATGSGTVKLKLIQGLGLQQGQGLQGWRSATAAGAGSAAHLFLTRVEKNYSEFFQLSNLRVGISSPYHSFQVSIDPWS